METQKNEEFSSPYPLMKKSLSENVLPLEEWEEMEAAGDHYRWEEQWRLSLDKKKICEDIFSETPDEFVREARKRFLENELTSLSQKISRLEGMAMLVWSNFCSLVPEARDWGLEIKPHELPDLKARYKRLYLEYASLRGGVEVRREGFSPQVVEECRLVPLEDLVGVPVVSAGMGRKKCLCPFHAEKTPSFLIYPDNSFFCFGCNSHGGNAIDYIVQKDGKNFREAVEYLKGFC